MAQFCLIPSLAEKFLGKLKSGEIKPDKLMEMTSEERRSFFSEFLGEENGKKVNAAFESKLLLKNQQEGIINWAKQVTGLKPEVQRDILSKVNRMTEILQPKEMDNFLEDLASQRLGIGVTAEEGSQIVDLSKKVAETKKEWDPQTQKWSSDEARLAYGAAKVEFGSYVGELKLAQSDRGVIGKLKKGDALGAVSEIAGTAKSLKASFDNSAIFRQGWKTIWTHPAIWAKNAALSFKDIAQSLKGKDVHAAVMADLESRPNAMNGLYKREKLALGNVEEAFPSQLPEKIPGIGRFYKASENAYQSFIYRMRADVFDKYIDIAQKSDAETTGIGRLVNSLTGRGHLGKFEPAAMGFNNIFFSPRFTKAQFDVLTGHLFEKGENFSKFARQQAAVNLLKVIAGSAAILAIAKAINKDSVEWDPRSSDFGKIRVGDTRFDVAGGSASLITLASRLGTLSTKSQPGDIKPLNAGTFGSQTGWDVLENFMEGKLSPVAGVFRDILKGQDFQGNKPTVQGELVNLFMPLPFTNAQELMTDPKAAPPLIAIIADALGIGTNTYNSAPKVPTLDQNNAEQRVVIDEIQRLGSESFKPSIANFDTPNGRLADLQKMLAPDKYAEAKQYFIDNFTKDVSTLINSDKYKGKPLDTKQKMLNSKNNEWLEKTLHQYGYKKPKPTHTPDVPSTP